ncbi:MAG TPA: hypothetical protein PKX04_09525 [Chitinophagales bacterium]|nr:hypothetical protein [Bacteroidota bacterium]HPE98187.1 hypothetical protein [Chitinophagales bacterium]HRX24329.1 hypothetical protein [Chitinophagales bacterium]
MNRNTSFLFLVLILLTANLNAQICYKDKAVVVIHNNELPLSEKKALVILPGLDENRNSRKHMQAFFDTTEYDLFIPDYIDHNSFENSIANFRFFAHEHQFEEYGELYFISYILGTWVLNRYLEEAKPGNVAAMVYDRSPLQERAALVATENIPFLARVFVGRVVEQLSERPYLTYSDTSVAKGIMIESRATNLIRFFRKKTLALGPINWQEPDLQQDHLDLMYVPLNHDQMYDHYELIGADILYFFKHHSFTSDARRTWYEWDPFTGK